MNSRLIIVALSVSSLSALVVAPVAAVAQEADAAVQGQVDAEGGHRRIVDVEVHPVFSVPDAIGVCVEGFPMRSGLSIAGCASIPVWLETALNLEVIYRFPLRATPTFNLSLGPAVGSHAIAESVHGPWIDVTLDGLASLEAVWWGETIGFQAQLGAGAMRFVWDRPEGINEKWFPIVDLTLGIAFRTKGAVPVAPKAIWGR